jgi:hypothetical protein
VASAPTSSHFFEEGGCFLQFRKRFVFCLGVRGFVSRPIRETLAFNPLGNERRTFPVFHLAGTKVDGITGSVAEIKALVSRRMEPRP